MTFLTILCSLLRLDVFVVVVVIVVFVYVVRMSCLGCHCVWLFVVCHSLPCVYGHSQFSLLYVLQVGIRTILVITWWKFCFYLSFLSPRASQLNYVSLIDLFAASHHILIWFNVKQLFYNCYEWKPRSKQSLFFAVVYIFVSLSSCVDFSYMLISWC